ncbi:MAG TPA: ComEC/Rec2 family competence protein [Acetobacteraceae bacterium]|nr:ComEC/Rec2 family competence protein [Acetobacteraceae bacterium]
MTAQAQPGALAFSRAGAAALLEAQHGRFAPWLAVSLGAGVLAYFSVRAEPGVWWLWAAASLLGISALVARRGAAIAWLVALVGAAALGFGGSAWHAARMPPPLVLPMGAVLVSGEISRVDLLPEGGRRVTLRAPRLDGGAPLQRTLRVRLRANDPARPAAGDRLAVRALVRPPSAPAAPGAWDFQRAAYFSGLGGSGFALGMAEVIPGPGDAAPLLSLRTRVEARVAEALPGAAGAVAVALLTGTQSAIPKPEAEAMRDSGLAHLLSVSGLHMTIVMGVAFGALRLLLALPPLALRLPGKGLAALGALAVGGFYMLLTGSEVPMQRCFAMAAIVTLGVLTGRRAISVRVLAFAAATVLLVDPVQIIGPSFQMSFAAVLALVAGMEASRGRLGPPRRDAGPLRRAALWLAASVVVSILAGAATAPYGLHHFGRLQSYGVLANAVAVPLTSVLVMPAGMLAMALMPLGLDWLPLLAMGVGVEGILQVARLVASFPGAAPSLAPLPGWSVAAATFGFCWLALWRGWLALLGVPVIVAGLGAGLAQQPPHVIVSADARLVVLRGQDGAWLHRSSGAPAFTRDAMLRSLGLGAAEPLPAEMDSEGLRCASGVCVLHAAGGRIAVLRQGRRGDAPDPGMRATACAPGNLVVSVEPLREQCGGNRVIDRFSVWRDGAHAAWLGPGGAVVVSDRSWRGARPWVPPPPMPGRPDPAPMAPVDTGD